MEYCLIMVVATLGIGYVIDPELPLPTLESLLFIAERTKSKATAEDILIETKDRSYATYERDSNETV